MNIILRIRNAVGAVLEKARNIKLVPKKIMVHRDGRSFETTVWVRPSEAKKATIRGANLDLFAEQDIEDQLHPEKHIKKLGLPIKKPDATKVAASLGPATNSPEMVRKRLAIEEPTGTVILKDGVKVARFKKRMNIFTNELMWSITDLKERKLTSLNKDPGEIVPACNSKEEALEKYALKLFANEEAEKAKAAASKERAKLIRDSRRAAVIAGATPATRQEATVAAFDDDVDQSVPVKLEPYSFVPGRTRVTEGELDAEVADFTQVIPSRIQLINKKTIQTDPRPSWIPAISENDFDKMYGRLEGVKIGEDRYLIATKPAEAQPSYIAKNRGALEYALVNLAVLTATQDYYTKLRNSKHDDTVKTAKDLGVKIVSILRGLKSIGLHATISDAENLASSLGGSLSGASVEMQKKFAKMAYERYDSYRSTNERFQRAGRSEYPLEDFIAAYNKSIEVQSRKSRPKTIGSNRASYSHTNLIAYVKPGSRNNTATWKEINEFLSDLKQMSIDMNLQMEENENTYSKGQETSYGKRGATKELYDTHGVLVKRQNGDEITPFEVDEIKLALGEVYGVFGDRSAIAKRTKLLISHSGDRLMHARKALGIYSPGRNAIGVTWQAGQKGAGFTLSHEFAHFMDHQLGNMSGRYNYASDDRGGLEYAIAARFRKHMVKEQKSDYQNRTCECFARALEQHFATKSGDAALYQVDRNSEGNHPDHETFSKHVAPLIEDFFKQKGEMIKSFALPCVKKSTIKKIVFRRLA